MPAALITHSAPIAPVVGEHTRHRTARGALDRDDAHARLHAHPELTRAAGQLHGGAARLDPAVAGEVQRAVEVLRRHQREDAQRLRGRDDVDVEPDRARHAHLAPEERELLRARGHAEAAHFAPVLRGPRLGLEAPVQLDAVLAHPHDGGRGVEVRDQPRGVPGRPAGQLALVEQHHVGPALAREVVGDAAAGDAAADDHHAGAIVHALIRGPVGCGRSGLHPAATRVRAVQAFIRAPLGSCQARSDGVAGTRIPARSIS